MEESKLKSVLENSKIPFVNLKSQYKGIKNEIDCAVSEVLNQCQFIQGKQVQLFEESFAEFCSESPCSEKLNAYCASCANGTDALEIALQVFEIIPGDEIITVSHSFFATVEAIITAKAIPKFVDIDPDTFLIDTAKIEEQITSRTRGIIAVHLYGQTCNMDEINKIAKKYNLFVIEDAAQAHGASWNGQRAGLLGDMSCFSFFPGKNLGCYGDGGALVSRHSDLIEKAKQIALHGRKESEKYIHHCFGRNSRLDNLQAAILNVKLKYLNIWNKQRIDLASYYLDHLKNLPCLLPGVHSMATPVWHLFVIRLATESIRNDLLSYLKSQNIEVGLHYPTPIHKQPAYLSSSFYQPSQLIETEKACQTLLSLPLCPELCVSQAESVIEKIKNYFFNS